MNRDQLSSRVRHWAAWSILLLPLLSPSNAPAATLEKLRATARQAIDQRLVYIDPPNIRIDGTDLSYYLGGAMFMADEFHDQSLGQTIGNQIRVELLRRSPRTTLGDDFWNPLFADVERSIASQLEVVEDPGTTPEARDQKVHELDDKIWKTYELAFDREARHRGLNAGMAAAAAGPKQVTLTTDPPGGKIHLMHVLDRQMAELIGQKPQWRAIDDPSSVSVNGKYWYSIERDGQTKVGTLPVDFAENENQTEYTLR